jgi:hypothetical protein
MMRVQRSRRQRNAAPGSDGKFASGKALQQCRYGAAAPRGAQQRRAVEARSKHTAMSPRAIDYLHSIRRFAARLLCFHFSRQAAMLSRC